MGGAFGEEMAAKAAEMTPFGRGDGFGVTGLGGLDEAGEFDADGR
jgi:hypothetical protein